MFDFETIKNSSRPLPFWSLNEKLDVNETIRQVHLMHQAGQGGFFLHARGGLTTAYMGEEWFQNIEAAIDTANKLGMQAWVYDENGWPSGFGDGKVNKTGIAYQQKYLRMEKGEKNTPYTIGNSGGYHFYFDVNPHYVDMLDEKVTEKFLLEIYEPYHKRFGNRFVGFFTDEPQLSRTSGYPWSFVLPEEYKAEYGEDLIPLLPELFIDTGNFEQTRLRFWRLVTRLFSENFTKKVYDWCNERGLKLTGHMLNENSLVSQLTSNGAVMPHYEYFHIPGVDWLGFETTDALNFRQISSVTEQLGINDVLTECGAMIGQGASLQLLKGILDWQMVRGINRFCPHLEGYSIRGIRKRDHPPVLYFQQPWWEEGYPPFADAVSRVGQILKEGKVECDTLLLHPQTTAWVCYNGTENDKLWHYNNKFLETVKKLEQKHIMFHLGDETIIERHAKVENGKFVIGKQKYSKVVMPEHIALFENTKCLLEEFKAQGGLIVCEKEVEPNTLIDNLNITVVERRYNFGKIYFFVNTNQTIEKAKITKGSKIIDQLTGTLTDFDRNYTFNPYESILVLDDGKPHSEAKPEPNSPVLSLDGEWEIESVTDNALVLDYCDAYFDGELVQQNDYILNIQDRACKLERPLNIKLVFRFNVKDIPKNAKLVCETPEKFKLFVNGKPLNNNVVGEYFDTSFKCIPLDNMLKNGENVIEAWINFTQSEEIYDSVRHAREFEAIKNKLFYDTEIEAMYIVGDFGVEAPNEQSLTTKVPLTKSSRYTSSFSIVKRPKTVKLANIHNQGFPFFAGKIILKRKFKGSSTPPILKFKKFNTNIVGVNVNGKHIKNLLWEPYTLPLCNWKTDRNTIELTLTTNLRNLLGPFHCAEGECTLLRPFAFYKEDTFWGTVDWNDDYVIANFGLE